MISKDKKKKLIISNLRNRNHLSRSSAIYLNEGCLPVNSIENYLEKKLLPNYPHLKNEKIYKNYNYLLDVYEFFLEIIYSKLNKIHNVNYSKKYWRILIGYWLFEFISIVFDNWKRLKYINSYYNLNYVEIVKFRNFQLYFQDSNDFSYKNNNDIFNNIIYEDLLKFFKNINIKYYFIKKNFYRNNFYHSIINSIISCMVKIIIFINSFFLGKNDAFFHNTYFSKKILFLLQIKLKQFPNFYISPKVNAVLLNKKMRSQTLGCLNDPFKKVLSKLIFKYIPTSFLENYHNYLNKTKAINWPKNPRFIFSSNSFFYDDFFKFWLAEKKEISNTKFISGQHGGSFFNTKFSFFNKHQFQISDLILTWGYKKKKYKPLFNFKTAGRKINLKKNGNLLFVHYSLSRFSGFHSIYSGFSYLKYLKDQINFIKKLYPQVQAQLLFREYVHNFGWNIDLKSLLKKKININVLTDTNKNIRNSLSRCRICFVNLNGTVFLETLNLNFPTIIFLNINNEPVNDDAKTSLYILKKAGILFYDYKNAARKINEIWDDVSSWWYSDLVQNAVNIYCNKFSKRPLTDPVKELYNIFKNFR